MRSNKNFKKNSGILILLLVFSILAFSSLAIYLVNTKAPLPYASGGQKVSFSTLNQSYRNNGLVFEPVEFTVTNNLNQPIFYLKGCAVQLPQIEKKQDQFFKSVPPEITCQAIAQGEKIPAGDFLTLDWDQKVGGRLVDGGLYRLRFEYSFDEVDPNSPSRPRKWEVTYSAPFQIEKTELTYEKSQEICRLFTRDLNSNGSRYQSSWCEETVRNHFQPRTSQGNCYHFTLYPFPEQSMARNIYQTKIGLYLHTVDRPKSCQNDIQYSVDQEKSNFLISLGKIKPNENCSSASDNDVLIPSARIILGQLKEGEYLIRIKNCDQFDRYQLTVEKEKLILETTNAKYGQLHPNNQGVYLFE